MSQRTIHAAHRTLAAACALALVGCSRDAGGGGAPDAASRLDASGRLDQAVTEGGPNPPAATIRVRNPGNCALALEASASTVDGRPWLSVSPPRMALDPGVPGELTASFDVVTTALPPGNYVGSVRLSGTCVDTGRAAQGSPQDIAVNLRVAPVGAGIATDPGGVNVDVVPLADRWQELAPNGLYAGRGFHTAVWTGAEMWVFGGVDGADTTLAIGGRYDPLTDSWATMPRGGPGRRFAHTAVWTGTEMIVWGGLPADVVADVLGTGGRLRAGWTDVSTVNAPAPRFWHTAVWTGREMIVFGGSDVDKELATGGRYDPATDTWTAITTAGAPRGRLGHAAVWTGREMLIWGGQKRDGTLLDDGGAYDPATDTWRPIPLGGTTGSFPVSAWTGSEWIVYGGSTATGYGSEGARYSPSRDTWSDIPADAPRDGYFHSSAVWTGAELVVWDGTGGRRYNPRTNSWAGMSAAGEPGPREAHTAVWTGNAMIVFGGSAGQSDGGVYR